MKMPRHLQAFTLLEVMVALGIFCIAIFSVLNLVNQNLRAARMLRPDSVDAGSLAAQLTLTNKLDEGIESGDFGDMYPGYSWTREISMVSTGGLFQVNFSVTRDGGGPNNESHMSLFLFRPDSPAANSSSRRTGQGGRQ